MPRVSIVIPVFNRDQLLLRAIESIEKQTLQDFEIIVVDDQSTIDIYDVIKDKSVRYLKSSQKGVSAARNTGILSAQSDWVAFLDSDDEWLPHKLEKQFSYLEENTSCRFVHSNEIWIRNGKIVPQSHKQKKLGGRIFSECTERCLIGASTVIANKNLLLEIGLFDETFPTCEDFDLWLRITARETIGFLHEPLTRKYAGHADQLSRQYHSMDLWRVRALHKQMNNAELSQAEAAELKKNLFLKAQILIQGLQKYPNPEVECEVKNYLID